MTDQRVDPYYIPSRPALMELYEGFRKAGLFPHHCDEADLWRKALTEFGVSSEPNGGWEDLALDLRLVNCALVDSVKAAEPGRREIATRMDEISKKLGKICNELNAFSWNPDVLAVTMRDDCRFQDKIADLYQLHLKVEKAAANLADWKQAPRWREAHNRSRRMELAIFLAPVFQKHWGLPAIPRGGSESRDLADTNDWTRFFQAVAFHQLGERISPDRQAVLWRATHFECVEYEPRVSANRNSLEP